jgi:hypothetical protein
MLDACWPERAKPSLPRAWLMESNQSIPRSTEEIVDLDLSFKMSRWAAEDLRTSFLKTHDDGADLGCPQMYKLQGLRCLGMLLANSVDLTDDTLRFHSHTAGVVVPTPPNCWPIDRSK